MFSLKNYSKHTIQVGLFHVNSLISKSMGVAYENKIVQRFSKYLLLMVKMTAMIASAWSLTLTLSISKLSLQRPAALPCSTVFSSQFYWGNKVISTASSAQSLHCVWLFAVPQTSLPVSLVHGISQAKTLEWVAISYTRGFCPPRLNPHLLHWQAGSLPLVSPGKPLWPQVKPKWVFSSRFWSYS